MNPSPNATSRAQARARREENRELVHLAPDGAPFVEALLPVRQELCAVGHHDRKQGGKDSSLCDPLETESSNRSMYLIIFTPGVLCKRRQSGKSLTDGALRVTGKR